MSSEQIKSVHDLSPAALAAYDAVIDVRAPAEFAEDHIPGAINLPVLDDAERAEIGTIYVRQSRYLARRLGAAKVSRNIARHLEEALADKPASFRPLLYCWRGGMRSGAMATVLARVGWPVGVVAGGYRTWRRLVVAGLRQSETPLPLVLLDGQTGVGKTALLQRLSAVGVQTLDLEGLAAHRGSVFGAHGCAGQPTQKLFESHLWRALSGFDLAQPIVVEAESNRIGRAVLPRRLWAAMLTAPRIELEAAAVTRARRLVAAYPDICSDHALLDETIERLSPYHPREAIDDWRNFAASQEFEKLALALIHAHYDPLYDRSRRKRGDVPAARFRLEDDEWLGEQAVQRIADAVRAARANLPQRDATFRAMGERTIA